MPSCAEGDGLGGVAETEGAREQREEKPKSERRVAVTVISFSPSRHGYGRN